MSAAYIPPKAPTSPPPLAPPPRIAPLRRSSTVTASANGATSLSPNLPANRRITIPLNPSPAPHAAPALQNMSLPSLANPPNMMPIGFSQVSSGTPHPHLHAVLNTIASEISSSIDNYLDLVLSTQLRSSLTLAATMSSVRDPNMDASVDPALLQQSMQCARAMILNCRGTVVPWLKAQLQEQASLLVMNNNGMKQKYFNYASVFEQGGGNHPNSGDSKVGSGNDKEKGKNGTRKRSVDVRNSQNSEATRRTSHAIIPGTGMSSPTPALTTTTSSEALLASTTTITVGPLTAECGEEAVIEYHIRQCEKLLKTNDCDGLQAYLGSLLQAFEDVYEGEVQSRPDSLDSSLFLKLSSRDVEPQEIMLQIMGNYGPASTTLVHSACALKRINALGILVSFGADPNSRNNRGVTPAQVCLETGDLAICTTLRDVGGFISMEEVTEIETKQGKSIDSRIVNALVGYRDTGSTSPKAGMGTGKGGEEKDKDALSGSGSGKEGKETEKRENNGRRNSVAPALGATIHTDAKMAEYAKIVLAQLPATVPPNAPEKQVSRWLERLVKYGEKEDVSRFLDSMTPQERVYYTGAFGHSKSTLLFTAAWNRRLDLIPLLIDTYKVDPTIRNVRRHTALTMCMEQNDNDGVQLLLEYGCSVSEKEVKEVEQRTGKQVDPRIVERVQEHCKLKKICSVFDSTGGREKDKEKDKDKEKPKKREAWRADLHREIERNVKFGEVTKVKEMLESLTPGQREAQLGPVGQTKSTLLFTAAWNRRADMCKILCEYKADVNHRNVRKNAAISMSVEQNDIDSVMVLLDAGADFSSSECREIEKRTGKTVDDRIYEAIFDFCNK